MNDQMEMNEIMISLRWLEARDSEACCISSLSCMDMVGLHIIVWFYRSCATSRHIYTQRLTENDLIIMVSGHYNHYFWRVMDIN